MHRKSWKGPCQDTVPITFVLGYGCYSVDYPREFSDWQAEAKLNRNVVRIETASGEVLWRRG